MTVFATFSRLNPQQSSAVCYRGSHLMITAGAGTGKTHTLTARAASLIADGIHPGHIAVFSFTNQSAQEIKSRVRALIDRGELITASTFHSYAYRALLRLGYLVDCDVSSVMDKADAVSLLNLLRKEFKLDLPKEIKSSKILDLISYEVNTSSDLIDLCERNPALAPYAVRIHALQALYQQFKRDNELLDFDDLLYNFLDLITQHPERSIGHLKHVLVDEFQDTNPLQLAILRCMVLAGVQLTVVGDPCQSIYSFRGATPSVMQEIAGGICGERVKTIVLNQNYRSCQPVLDYANRVIRACPNLIRKDLCSLGIPGSAPVVTYCKSEQAEAVFAAQQVKQALDQYPADQVAVLYSSSHHSLALQMELTKLQIPFVTKGGLRLHDSAHVKDMLALVRLSVDRWHTLSLRRVLLLIPGIGEKTAARIAANPSLPPVVPAKALRRFQELQDMLESVRWAAPEKVWKAALRWYEPLISKLHHRFDLEQVGKSCLGYELVERFLDDMTLDNGQQEDDAGKVCLSTVHSAKGKQFAFGCVIGLAEGRFSSASEGTQAYYEAIRLLFVAVTRFKHGCAVTVPLFCRTKQGAYSHVKPSSLLPS